MVIKSIPISSKAVLTAYLIDESAELAVLSRPAVLVLPGGAYMMCSDREAEPVALAYAAEGFHSFVLRYTTEKDFAPAFEEAQKALDLIREHAEEWHIIPERVAVCGFSAGGHLAAAIDDPVVPLKNSIALAGALEEKEIPFECHIFRQGGHGIALAKRHTSSGDPSYVNDAVAQWFSMSVRWLKETMGDVEIRKQQTLSEGLAPSVAHPILELTAGEDTNAVLLKYSDAFASRQMLAMAGDTPVPVVLRPLGLSNKQMLALSWELQTGGVSAGRRGGKKDFFP